MRISSVVRRVKAEEGSINGAAWRQNGGMAHVAGLAALKARHGANG